MTFAEDGGPIEETLGPGTDLVISLFSTFLLFGVLGAALSGVEPEQAQPPKATAKPREDVIALDSVEDGFQHFRRQSADVDAIAVPAIVKKLRPLEKAFDESEGRSLVHVIGYASPEPFGTDDGEGNFQLALQRAMTIAVLAHRALRIPFECLRVHGYGRGESTSLTQWLGGDTTRTIHGWDDLYRERREKERSSWVGGPVAWQGAYALGKTDLGRELSAERRVVLKTEFAENDLCGRAFKVRPAPGSAAPMPPPSATGARVSAPAEQPYIADSVQKTEPEPTLVRDSVVDFRVLGVPVTSATEAPP
jgi:hypothetical protein